MSDNHTVKLFYSYSHKDESLRDQLETHLKLLQQQKIIDSWHDRKIGIDTDWKNAIDVNLEAADIILLLVSADFLASDYCFGIEIKRAMQHHQEKSAVVIPVSLRPCDTNGAEFMKLQGLPKNFKPVTKWINQDEAFTDIAKGIRAVAESIRNSKNNSVLLSSFYLENFRLFNKLEVKQLGRVNLLVGRNNSGKSAFLEAVYIYATGADREVFAELMQSRQEHWNPRGQDEAKGFSFSPFRHFFKGHKIPLLNEAGFKLAAGENARPLHIKTAAYVSEKTDAGFTRRKLDDAEDIELQTLIGAEVEVFVVAEQNNKTQLLFSEERGFDLRRKLFSSKKYPSATSAIIQLVPTQGISDHKAAQLWDAINLTDLSEVVIDGLKLIEARLLGLAFVENPREDRIPLVKLQDQEERVPLKSLGDGVSRVFHIMLALVNAKGGVLLIDEFENGLHWTVQESVWRVLFQMAARLNVQVFCTTHSRDCINAFGTVWQAFENEGAFFRLYAHDTEIRVREYDLETLSDSLETDVDVR